MILTLSVLGWFRKMRGRRDLKLFEVQLSIFLLDLHFCALIKFLVDVHGSIQRKYIIVEQVCYFFKCILLKKINLSSQLLPARSV